jgi:conjugal transfer pilus assembly protein TraI
MPTNFRSIDSLQKIGELSKRVELIRQCANEAKPVYFEEKWMGVLVRCAEWHSSQPLSPDLYREPGGALRWTIELAFYAMRLAGAQKFAANLTSEERRRVEPQYNYGVFIAAVCSGLDEPHRHFRVIRAHDDAEWNPSAHGALNPWLNGAEFRLGRREVPLPVERMRTGVLAQLIVGRELLSALDTEVLAQIFGAINPAPMPMQGESITHKVVREAVKVATDFDRKAQRAEFAPVEFSVPPAIDVANVLVPVQEAVSALPPVDGVPTTVQVTPAATKAPSNKPVDPRQISLLDGGPDYPAAADTPPADAPTLENGLSDYPPMIVDFFRALKEDVESGKAKVAWGKMGLTIPKRILAGYGIASDSLIEVLRKKGVLLENNKTEIMIAQAIGRLITAREEASA